jgi:hypothetical protein
MADRYWVDGSGTWDTGNTANWSATDGGAGGASVPGSADDVFFNSASGGPGTITLTGALSAKSLTTTNSTFAFVSTGTLSLSGNITLSASTVWAATGTITVDSSSTLTTNSVVMSCNITLNSAGNTFQLGSNMVLNATLTLTNGTLTTNNYSVTLARMVFATGTRTLNMGSSVFTLQGAAASNDSWAVDDPVNLTINSGTSEIRMAEAFTGINQQNFKGGGFVYWNLLYTENQASTTFGNNTFNTISNTVQPIVLEFEASTTTTVTNFAVSGSAGNFVVLRSTAVGTSFTLTKSGSGTVAVLYCNIEDSVASPSDTWYAPDSVGVLGPGLNVDDGGNTGWIFGALLQAYRLTQTGVLYSSVAEFDEVTQTTISMSQTAMYADEFDEITVMSMAMSYEQTGTVKTQTEFDEITVIVPG